MLRGYLCKTCIYSPLGETLQRYWNTSPLVAIWATARLKCRKTAKMPSQRKDGKQTKAGKDIVVFRTLEKLASDLLRLGLDAPRAEYLLRSAFVFEADQETHESLATRTTQSQIAYIAGVNRVDVRKVLASQNRSPTRLRLPATLNRELKGFSMLGVRTQSSLTGEGDQKSSHSLAQRTSSKN